MEFDHQKKSLAYLQEEYPDRLYMTAGYTPGTIDEFAGQKTEDFRCDLVFVDTSSPEIEGNEMARFKEQNLVSCNTLLLDDHGGQDPERPSDWKKALDDNLIRELACFVAEGSGKVIRWCFGKYNLAECQERRDWRDPPQHESRKDGGEYLWSIGLFETSDFGSFEASQQVQNPVLSGKHIVDMKGEYMADPFIVQHGGVYLMFFEVWNHDDKQGDIGFASSPDGLHWKYECVVIDEDFHMSYPYVFRHEDEYYMIPETHAAGHVRLYRATAFPFTWEKVKVLIDEDLCDASVVLHENTWYMFAAPPTNDKVVLYHSDSLTGEWKLHEASPVLEGKKQGRPGGRIVKRASESTTGLILYVQDCEGAYGKGINAFEIQTLSKKVAKVRKMSKKSGLYGSKRRGDWNRFGMHHVDVFQASSGKFIAAADGWRLRDPNFEF